MVGLTLAAINFLRIFLTYPGRPVGVAATVAIATIGAVVLAKTIGGLLPVIATKFHADPAMMAGPLITTICDAVTLILYFNIAKVILKI